MTLMPDDEPQFILSPEVIPPDVGFLPALSAGQVPVSPARAYLLSLNSVRSRQTMTSYLNIAASLLGAASLDTCCWGSLRRHHVMAGIPNYSGIPAGPRQPLTPIFRR